MDVPLQGLGSWDLAAPPPLCPRPQSTGCGGVGALPCNPQGFLRLVQASDARRPGASFHLQGQPGQWQAEAMPSDRGSCVGGPSGFLMTLCSRQDKIMSLEKHV